MKIDINVIPSGYGTTTGQGTYEQGTKVTLTALPNSGKKFLRWEIVKGDTKLPFNLAHKLFAKSSLLSNENPYVYTVASETQINAYFRDLYTFKVNPTTFPNNVGSVWKSSDTVVEGNSVTLKAREEQGYSFSHWSNGSTENPITINNVESNVTLTANYISKPREKTYYQYRAFIKDQLSLNSLPKAIVTVTSFEIRRDLLTTANSSFTVLDISENINNGDILALYNPQGKVIYYGVISAIEDDTIETEQIQSFYKGSWVYDVYPSDNLETEVQYLLNRYANGYQKGATYQDTLMYQEKAPLTIKTGSATSGKLETKDANETMDMEEFIYSLYSNYGLILDFEIPYGEWNIGDEKASVTIRKPIDSIIKIGNNAECIVDMTPITEIEETNKLIVYSNDGVYRTTYIATSTNGIVQEPSSVVGRYGVIQTNIVFSDDDLEVIKDANITADMFNHKVEFNLLLDNNLYDFWSWELGQTLQIYNNGDYYNSIFTGYELSKEENQNPTEVKVIAGKVRNSLTKILTLSMVKR